MNHSKHSGPSHASGPARVGRTPTALQPVSRSTMSLARLAAEAAFRPQTPTSATDPSDPTESEPVQATTGSSLTSPAIESRKPRVFRLAAPATVDALPQKSALSAGAAVAAVAALPVRKSSPDKRPGPVSVVYSRPPEPVVENPSATPAMQAASLPARQSPDANGPADALIAGGLPFAPVSVTYRNVIAGLAELSAVIAEIKAARSFGF